MSYTFRPVKRTELGSLYADYLASLASPFDSFLEAHILPAEFFAIDTLAGKSAGFFAIFEDNLLTQFYVTPARLRDGQPLFARILAEFPITQAYVPSGDETFLSHAADKMAKLEIQAYFFQDGRRTDLPAPAFGAEQIRPATASDIPGILAASGDFFDQLAERIAKGEIFVLEQDGQLLGIGIIEWGRLLPETASIGMFTVEAFRKQGVGRAILRHLKTHCLAHGRAPVAGCWAGNHASKRTLQAAGMVTKTRLFRVTF